VSCSCGNTFKTRSTVGKDLQVDVFELPSFLYRQAEDGRHGRSRDKFRKKYAAAAAR
jgi:large subunit ribosomal protein L31